jgi:hypothetical protein
MVRANNLSADTLNRRAEDFVANTRTSFGLSDMPRRPYPEPRQIAVKATKATLKRASGVAFVALWGVGINYRPLPPFPALR